MATTLEIEAAVISLFNAIRLDNNASKQDKDELEKLRVALKKARVPGRTMEEKINEASYLVVKTFNYIKALNNDMNIFTAPNENRSLTHNQECLIEFCKKLGIPTNELETPRPSRSRR